MEILALQAVGFRNLAPTETEFAPRFNVITGNNGQGKTNLLEAVAVLGNLQSFRTADHRRIVTHEQSRYQLVGRAAGTTGGRRLAQQAEVGPPLRRTLEVDGRTAPVERYLTAVPVVTIVPNDRALVLGEPAVRRSFLDRFAFLLEPALYHELRLYRRLLRQRNAGLVDADDRTLEAFEQMMAPAAAGVVIRRRRAMTRLAAVFGTVYEGLSGEGFPAVTLSYRGEAWLSHEETPTAVENAYLRRYNANRARDRLVGYTVEGPHRHDLGLRACGRAVRDVLSSGQSKVVVAALRLAMLEEVERERGEQLPVIVDDIDAELDRAVLGNLVRRLSTGRQVLLSCADSERVLPILPGSRRLHLKAGICTEVATCGE